MSINTNRNEISRMLRAGSSANGIVDSLGVHRATVFRVKKMKEGKSIECAKPTGRKRASRTENAAKAIIKSLKEDQTKSMRSLVKEHFLALATALKIVKEAGGNSKAIVKRPLLSEKTRALRLERAKKLLNDLKHIKDRLIFFSDEKTFTVDPVRNRRNDRYVDNAEDHVR